jgi:fructosamine-3-kinase
VGGGCIHHALAVETDHGPVFLKWDRGEAGSGFGAEARGLDALREAAAEEGLLAVPEVLDARDAEGDDSGWLALEFLPPASPAPDHDRRLGRGLALLHARLAPSFGWPETNRIGPLPQPNPAAASWPDFWADARLTPQIRATRDEGGLDTADVDLLERVVEAVPAALAPVAEVSPQLVHGDLWSGNVHPGPDGRPVLVDPAAYHGHGEVDLAMARLFGGFGGDVFAAYREVLAAPDGFDAVRCPLYQLYWLLVHVRLFGRGYLGRTRSAARAVLSEVG